MDWEALYTAGQLWTMVHNYTLSMFNKENPDRPLAETQQAYARFVSPLLQKVEEPARSAILQSILHECEAFGWETAKEEIVSFIVNNNIIPEPENPFIGRMMQGYRTYTGQPAPLIPGVSNLSNSFIVFYESGCGNCEKELDKLKQLYPRLQESGWTVISVSADTDKEVYNRHSRSFPWENKLCDYKGFEGEIFSTYGITATPTIFLVGKERKVTGRYANLEETGVF
jgi:AhpC/TSA family.